MECRGSKRREWIVDNYKVIPVAHIQLLAGQTKHSDANAMIENDYYIFCATDKTSGKKEIIQCGMGAARDFLRLLGHKGLPLFNPLRGKNENYKKGVIVGNGVRKQTEVWNPTAKQLFNAIMWIILIIDAKPNTPVFNIKDEVCKFKDREPFASKVKAVNTIIDKNFGGKTLTEAINELRANNDVRDSMCQFDKLVSIINNYTDRDKKKVKLVSFFNLFQ